MGGIKPHLFNFICLEYKVIHVEFRLPSVSDPFYQDASHADPGLNQQVSHSRLYFLIIMIMHWHRDRNSVNLNHTNYATEEI